ncbi:sigma-70 family RNA polymerase sigma factor [Desulfobacterota bacterium AH_259_B03_O07]|nr:sigma-70 family RNA polymerase sigma factor [Desulfobacterota bacterium AH_259_B03_O07]
MTKKANLNQVNTLHDIKRIHKAIISDISNLEQIIGSLNEPLLSIALSTIFLFLSGTNLTLNIVEKFLKNTSNYTNQKKESFLSSLKSIRFSVWSYITIMEYTPNPPWEKLAKYLKRLSKESKNNKNQLRDTMVFYFLDRLEILKGKRQKEKYWEIAKEYLEKNVFDKVLNGFEPPPVETIIDSLKRKFKRFEKKEKKAISVHGIEPKKEEFTKEDLDVLKRISSSNQLDELVGVSPIYQLEQINKLKEAVKLLTPKQSDIIKLRYYDSLTTEEVGKKLGITRQTVNQHEKAAIKKLKPILKPLYHPFSKIFKKIPDK